MLSKRCRQLLERNPIIAAVRSPKQLDTALQSNTDVVFILCGNIFNLDKMVSLVKKNGKRAFIHLDLLKGFALDNYFVKYLAEEIKPEGVISTRNSLLQRAKQDGLSTIQRIFMLDSSALDVSLNSIKKVKPDAVEILPGCAPKLIEKIKPLIEQPIITGGFIDSIEDIKINLQAGAISSSTSNPELWSVNLTS